MFNTMKSESEKNNIFIRTREPNETDDAYIKYLSSQLKYIKEEQLKVYLLDNINSLKSRNNLLSEKGNSIIHDINKSLAEDDNKKASEKNLGEKLIFLQNLLRGRSQSASEIDPNEVKSLNDIRMAYEQAASSTMGQKNSLQDIKIGDIIKVQPGTIIYDDSSMEGLGINLDALITKRPFLVDNVLYYEKKEFDGQLQWVRMEMLGNIQEATSDYNMRVGYNPSQYCKICHIFQCTDDGQIIPSGINGYIHNCEYELLEAKEEMELAMVA